MAFVTPLFIGAISGAAGYFMGRRSTESIVNESYEKSKLDEFEILVSTSVNSKIKQELNEDIKSFDTKKLRSPKQSERTLSEDANFILALKKQMEKNRKYIKLE